MTATATSTAASAPRRGLPRWSVRSRILTSILLVAALGLAGAGVATFLLQRTTTLANVDSLLLSRVESARDVATKVPNPTPTSIIKSVLTFVLPNVNESSLGIVDGQRFTPGSQQNGVRLSERAFVSRVTREVASGRVWLGSDTLEGHRIRYVAVPIVVPGNADNGIYVDAVDLDGELAPLTTFFSTYAVVAAIALIVIGGVSWFVAGRLLRPIRRLRLAASRITASELSERIPVDGRDDVSELTSTVNGMLDRLDLAMTSQRQLLDDVRHELKTPITILRGHLELLDPANVAEVVSTQALAVDELDRMSGLVDDIEALAEMQGANLTLRPTDVADLTADVYAKVSVLGGHEWKLDGAAQASVMLDPARITQAWLQLADNAAKYSAEGTTIVLGSRVVDDDIEFWVQDAGPGIPADSFARIFERFGRVDTGRGIRGSGLGLPIVRAIAEGHGGRVTLASSTGGSRFGILIPESPDGNSVIGDTESPAGRGHDA
jgi:two-component system OmpR family sensor kinase